MEALRIAMDVLGDLGVHTAATRNAYPTQLLERIVGALVDGTRDQVSATIRKRGRAVYQPALVCARECRCEYVRVVVCVSGGGCVCVSFALSLWI